MSVIRTDGYMAGTRTPHTAGRRETGWAVSWLPGVALSEAQALEAMLLAEAAAAAIMPGERVWDDAEEWAYALGMTAAEALARARACAPEPAGPGALTGGQPGPRVIAAGDSDPAELLAELLTLAREHIPLTPGEDGRRPTRSDILYGIGQAFGAFTTYLLDRLGDDAEDAPGSLRQGLAEITAAGLAEPGTTTGSAR